MVYRGTDLTASHRPLRPHGEGAVLSVPRGQAAAVLHFRLYRRRDLDPAGSQPGARLQLRDHARSLLPVPAGRADTLRLSRAGSQAFLY